MQRSSRVFLVLAVVGAGCGTKGRNVDGAYGPFAHISYTSRDKTADGPIKAIADVAITLASESATIKISKASVDAKSAPFAGFQCVGPFKVDADAAVVTAATCVMLDDRGAPKGDECKLTQNGPLALTFDLGPADSGAMRMSEGLHVDIAETDATKCPLAQFSAIAVFTQSVPMKKL